MIGAPVFTRDMGRVIIQDETYRGMRRQAKADLSAWVNSLSNKNRKMLEDMTRLKGSIGSIQVPYLPGEQGDSYFQTKGKIYDEALKTAKHQVWQMMKSNAQMQKTGVNTGIGYNFYDLRGPVQLLFPFYTPFRNATPRPSRVNDGVGTAAHYQQITNPGYSYPGVPEAQRTQITTPNMLPVTATYKEFGKENQVTYTAEFAGEGFNDNLATERLDGLLALFLAEEAQILNGNSGTASGNNGFALGVPPTPTMTLVNVPSTLATGTSVTVYVVALTAMANPQNAQYGYYNAPLTVAGGLTPTFSYSAPGTGQSITITGGTSKLSLASATSVTTSGNPSVTASIAAQVGALGGYAWFVSTNSSPSTANAYLAGITQGPSFTVSAAPAGTQTAAAFNSAGGSVDNSYNPYDMDGLFTWAAKYGQWVSQWGQGPTGSNSLTPLGNGKVLEIENMLQTIFTLYQTSVDEIWGDQIAVECLDQAVRYGGTSATGYQFVVSRDGQNNLLGGFIVSGYQSRYAVANPTGANVLPIRIHPMIPPGTLLFNTRSVPAGYSHSRLPYIYGMLVQRDYYGIEWPPLFRGWNFGTYVHEVMAHLFPGLMGVITGIGAFVP